MVSRIERLLARSCVLLLLICPLSTAWACFPDLNNHIEVSLSGPCSDIQAAIDVADGFTLLTVDVLPGYYILNTALKLKSNVDLLGAGPTTTRLSRANNATQLIVIKNSDNITVSGFNLSDSGIEIISSNNLTISNNTISGTKYGLLGTFISGLTVSNNSFNQNDYGIVLEEVDTTLIDNNIIDAGLIRRQGDGMNLWQALATVTNNTIQGNVEAGIEIGYGDYTITGNTIAVADCSARIIEVFETNTTLTPATKNITANTTTCG